MNKEEVDVIIEKAMAILGEHFDSVQILASYNEEDETRCSKRGCGNWYARVRMAQELILEDNARIHHQVRKEEFGSDE